MWQQVKFQVISPDLMVDDSDNIFGGIAETIDDHIDEKTIPLRIICGCCGSEFEPNEVKILRYYHDWMDLTETIAGE